MKSYFILVYQLFMSGIRMEEGFKSSTTCKPNVQSFIYNKLELIIEIRPKGSGTFSEKKL